MRWHRAKGTSVCEEEVHKRVVRERAVAVNGARSPKWAYPYGLKRVDGRNKFQVRADHASGVTRRRFNGVEYKNAVQEKEVNGQHHRKLAIQCAEANFSGRLGARSEKA